MNGYSKIIRWGPGPVPSEISTQVVCLRLLPLGVFICFNSFYFLVRGSRNGCQPPRGYLISEHPYILVTDYSGMTAIRWKDAHALRSSSVIRVKCTSKSNPSLSHVTESLVSDRLILPGKVIIEVHGKQWVEFDPGSDVTGKLYLLRS